MMKQTGPPMTSVLRRATASAKLVWSSSTLRTSQTVGYACLARTLTRSWLKSLALRVSTLTEKAPWRTPVRAKTLPATVSTLKTFLSPAQNSTLTTNLEKISHISKSRLRPWRILPWSLRTRRPVQALKVENSYMKLRKKRRSKGRPLSSATADTSATKSWCLNSFLAYHSTPSKKPLGIGNRSKNSMKRASGSWQSRITAAHRTFGGSARLTLQASGAWLSMGPTRGTTVASATATSTAATISLPMIDQ